MDHLPCDRVYIYSIEFSMQNPLSYLTWCQRYLNTRKMAKVLKVQFFHWRCHVRFYNVSRFCRLSLIGQLKYDPWQDPTNIQSDCFIYNQYQQLIYPPHQRLIVISSCFRAVLENHHAALAFQLTWKEDSVNIFKNLIM